MLYVSPNISSKAITAAMIARVASDIIVHNCCLRLWLVRNGQKIMQWLASKSGFVCGISSELRQVACGGGEVGMPRISPKMNPIRGSQ